jgi:predicted RecA/RadA family phage recombinase
MSTSAYQTVAIQTKVMIRPDQLDAQIYAHMKNNLRLAVLNSGNEYGIVTDIYKAKPLDCEFRAENMEGNADTTLVYSCRLCSVQVGKSIICEIRNLTPFIVANNGPIMFVVVQNDFSKTNFTMNGNYLIHKATGRKIAEGDLVRVKAKFVRHNMGGSGFLCTGSLENIASSAEADAFRKDTGKEKVTTSMVTAEEVNPGIMTPGSTFENISKIGKT